MKEKTRIKNIKEILRSTYPNVKTQLHYRNPFELLIATILSAQCTDKQVNAVTHDLFETYKTPEDFAAAPLEDLEQRIHSTGFYHNKAKNIKNCAQALIESFDGEVPRDLDEMIKLPGVGRKTASVVLSQAFGIPAIAVDTHVTRTSRRLGLTTHKDPTKIEFDLKEIFPKKEWGDFGTRLIFFGREYCKARKPLCDKCPLEKQCNSEDKTV